MTSTRTVLAAVALLVVGGCGQSGGAGPTASPPTEPVSSAVPLLPSGEPTVLATELEAPWDIAFVGDTALISSRDNGEILELTGDGTTRVVGTVPGVVHRSESGLLGIAVDGAGWLYAYSTGAEANRIQRFALNGTPGSYALGPPETILDQIPAAATHNGGRLAFGPDGMLYATTGDAGSPDDAQDPDSLAGKILRMTPDGAVPHDNPVAGSLVLSLGHRNPQGLAWTEDGTLFAAEFGQNTWDELNLITPGGNYGWPEVEGIADDRRFIDPVQQWAPADASPSGIAIAGGTLFMANLRGQVLRSVPLADPTASSEHEIGDVGRLRHVAVAPDGALWILTNNTDGRGDPRPGDDHLLRVDLAAE